MAKLPGWAWGLGGAGLLIWGAFKVAKMVRGIRNNNPGNLRPMPSQKWEGETAPDTAKGGPFSRFTAPYYGWRAATIDIYGDITKRGQDTLRRLVFGTPEKNFQDAYAPPSENDAKRYLQVLVDALKIAPDMKLNPWLHGPALLRAIAKHENGLDPDTIWGATPREEGIAAGRRYVLGA